ncbi:MAG: hypothetical protein ACTMIR_03715 [Cellulomonadaceae bacterium]
MSAAHRGRDLVRRPLDLVRRAREGRQDRAESTDTEPLGPLEALIDRAVQIPSATIRKHVDSLRERNPQATPAQLVRLLEREYLRVVQATGGAVGAAAAIPAVGTGTAALLTSSDVATFFAASGAFSFAVADVHGIAVTDTGRRRALLLATILGEDAVASLGAASVVPWGRMILTHMPQQTVVKVNKMLTGTVLRRYLAKQSGLALGRMVPFGVGALVGVAGARALGQGVIAQSRRAFGLPPAEFGVPVRVVETGGVPLIIAPPPEE